MQNKNSPINNYHNNFCDKANMLKVDNAEFSNNIINHKKEFNMIEDYNVSIEQNNTNKEQQIATSFETMWQSAVSDQMIIMNHNYIKKKQIQSYGLRASQDKRNLIIPLHDEFSNMKGLQSIELDGNKNFKSGTKKQGNFFALGDYKNSDTIIICEGYATGASIYEAINIPVIIAFDAGNLEPVVAKMTSLYLDKKFIICGDEDCFKEKNVGRGTAEYVAKKYRTYAAFPIFSNVSKENKATDFNDLHVLEGLDVLKSQLEQIIIDSEKFYSHIKYRFPANFFVKEDGVYYKSKDGLVKISSKIETTAKTVDDNDCNHGIILEWKSSISNKHHSYVMYKRLLAKDSTEIIQKLLDEGVEIICKHTKIFIEYLQSIKPFKVKENVSKIGWHKNAFILTDRIIPENSNYILVVNNKNNFANFDIKGSLKDWQANIGKFLEGNSRLVFATSCNFSAPLLKLFNAETCIFHFFGESSSGKTTILKVAKSISSNPIYISTWRSTDNAQEAKAAGHNDSVLYLDEISQANSNIVDNIIYMLGNNKGKDRCNNSAILKESREWKLVAISSGEVEIEDKLQEVKKRKQPGVSVRCMDLPAVVDNGFGIFEELHHFQNGSEFSQYLNTAANNCYGAPLDDFLKLLVFEVNNRDVFNDEVNKIRNRFKDFIINKLFKNTNDNGQVGRVIDHFSWNVVGGELAISWGILNLPSGSVFDAAYKLFMDWLKNRNSVNNLEYKQIIDQVLSTLQERGHSLFPDLVPKDNFNHNLNEIWGYKELLDDGMHFYVFQGSYKNKLCKGFNIKTANKALNKINALEKDTRGRSSIFKKLPGIPKSERCYHIKPNIFNENEIIDLD